MGKIIFLTVIIPLLSVVLCPGLRPRAHREEGLKDIKDGGMGSFVRLCLPEMPESIP